jgi:hypothetical protein
MQSQQKFDNSKPTTISTDEMSNLHSVHTKRKNHKMRENTDVSIVSSVLPNNRELHSAADSIMRSQ